MRMGYISPHKQAACVWTVWQAGTLHGGLEYGRVIPAAAGIESFITSFDQDEQNNQTGLLKVFVPTTK